MANQAEPGTLGGAAQAPDSSGDATSGSLTPQPQAGPVAAAGAPAGGPVHATFHGRPISWVAVATIIVGFIVGAFALAVGHGGPTWWLFWLGAGLAVLGLLISMASRTFDDWY